MVFGPFSILLSLCMIRSRLENGTELFVIRSLRFISEILLKSSLSSPKRYQYWNRGERENRLISYSDASRRKNNRTPRDLSSHDSTEGCGCGHRRGGSAKLQLFRKGELSVALELC